MDDKQDSQEEKLARLQKELKNLKSSFPEHCHGTEGYINVHSATPEHLQKLEDLEDEIEKLKAELGQ